MIIGVENTIPLKVRINIVSLVGLRLETRWHWLISWGVTGTFFTLLRYLAIEDNQSDNDGAFTKIRTCADYH